MIKYFFVALMFSGAVPAEAAVHTANLKGRIVSFDQKIVTIELAGQNYKFDRTKLGAEFASIRKGDVVELSLENKSGEATAGEKSGSR